MQHLLEQHCSPDGLLTLKVVREDDGSICIGFDGYAWHTHGDILAALAGLPEEDAVRKFVDDAIDGRAIIVISRASGRVRDVWIADEPVLDGYQPEGETIEFRHWDGRAIA